MHWPLRSKPVSGDEIPYFNMHYLHAPRGGGPDSTIAWTSEIDWDALKNYIDQTNHRSPRLIGSSHVLIQAVGRALQQHPEINRRVAGHRIFEYQDCNVCLATRPPTRTEVNVVLVRHADQKTALEIADQVWHSQLSFVRQDSPDLRDQRRLRRLPGWAFRNLVRMFFWLDRVTPMPVVGRLDRLRESCVLVNDYSHDRFPVMRGYKPSRLPDESKSLNVTLGRPEEKVVWRNGRAACQRVAPICVRVDHRICDGYQLSQFINTLIRLLSDPAQMEMGNQPGREPVVPVGHLPLRKAA